MRSHYTTPAGFVLPYLNSGSSWPDLRNWSSPDSCCTLQHARDERTVSVYLKSKVGATEEYDRFKQLEFLGSHIYSTSLIILGALAKLRKVTISFVMSVRPVVRLSARMEKLGSHWTDFDKIWYLRLFRKPVDKIQVSLKSDKNNGYFTSRRFHIYDNISLNSSQNEKYFKQKF
jgi:hypothetical protein